MALSGRKLYFLLACLFALAFIVFTYLVFQGLFLSFNQYINRVLVLDINSPLYIISRMVAYLYILFIVIILYLGGIFIIKRRKYEALMILTSFSGAIAAEFILKPIFQIQCPNTALGNLLGRAEVFGFLEALQSLGLMETCYPSSHVASYVVFSGYLTYLALKFIKVRWQRFIALFVLLGIIIVVGPTRVYLHVHWFSDVVGGYLLGFSLLMFILAFRKKPSLPGIS